MNEDSAAFKLEHLDRYAIVTEPCTLIVKNNSRLKMDDLFTEDSYPRWILNIKAISAFNLELLKTLCAEGTQLTYGDMGHLLMTGALWEEQVSSDCDLPSKGEEIIAVFGWVKGVIMCTNITLIPRRQPDIYLHSCETLDEINEFERIIKEMKDEE